MPLLYGGSYNQKKGAGPSGYEDFFSSYKEGATPDLASLQKKYMGMVPKVDIETDSQNLYENIMGPARQDVQGAQEKIGLGMQAKATGGSSYEDMLARYLPGATEQMADVSSKAGVAGEQMAQTGQIATAQAETARFRAASDMAIAEKSIAEEGRRFMLDLKARIQMAEREIRAKERIALQQARSGEHIARIRANAQRESARIQANAQMEATKFSQEQENYRNNVRMQVYDKYFTGQLKLGERKENRLGTQFGAKFPSSVTGAGAEDPYANYPNAGYGGGEGGARGYPAGTEIYGPDAYGRKPSGTAPYQDWVQARDKDAGYIPGYGYGRGRGYK